MPAPLVEPDPGSGESSGHVVVVVGSVVVVVVVEVVVVASVGCVDSVDSVGSVVMVGVGSETSVVRPTIVACSTSPAPCPDKLEGATVDDALIRLLASAPVGVDTGAAGRW